MSKRVSAKLSPSTKPSEKQILEVIEESSLQEQKEEPVLPELDMEIEYPQV